MGNGALLGAALLASVAGMGWCALSMRVHAVQVWGRVPSTMVRGALRAAGAVSLVAALALCLAADHASMAVLVWAMAMTAAALSIAMTLASRPRVLRVLAPSIRARRDD